MSKAQYTIPLPPKVASPNNMGLLRYYLALAVIVAHFNVVAGTEYWWPNTSFDGVSAFFILSGFLIWGSFLKSRSTVSFLRRRFMRIFPCYATVIIVAAVGCCLLTTLPLADYFTHPQFWKYLACNLAFWNHGQPDLPGVFADNAVPAVNGSLWTIKVELMLYCTVPMLAWTLKKLRWKPLPVMAAIVVASLAWRVWCRYMWLTTDNEAFETWERQFPGQLCYFYLGGIASYIWPWMAKNWKVLLPIGVLLYVIGTMHFYGLALLPPFALCMLVITLSFAFKMPWYSDPKKNFSYDIYLWHFPIFQAAAASGLLLFLGPHLTFVVTVAVIALVGWVSWTKIGSPALNWTKNLGKRDIIRNFAGEK